MNTDDPYDVAPETPAEALRSMIGSWVRDPGKQRIMLATLEELVGDDEDDEPESQA